MEEAVVKRIMPHSNEAEQAVIGSMTVSYTHLDVYKRQIRY